MSNTIRAKAFKIVTKKPSKLIINNDTKCVESVFCWLKNDRISTDKKIDFIFFSSLEELRRIDKWNYTHLLSDVLLLVITGIMCVCDKWETVENWKQEFFSLFEL